MNPPKRCRAVLDMGPLTMTCALGWPDVQGQAHIGSLVCARHGGIEAGRFLQPEGIAPLIRKVVRQGQANASARVNGIYVSIPSEYVQVYMREAELALDGPVQREDLDALARMAREVPVPEGYRMISCQSIAWQLDRQMLYRSVVGMRGRLIKGYYALQYGYNPYCRDMADRVDGAGLKLKGFVSLPGALVRYGALRKNLLSNFVLLDADDLYTHLMVGQRGKLWLMDRVNIGSERLRKDIMTGLACSYEEACAALKAVGLGRQAADSSPAAQMVGLRLTEIFDWARQALEPAHISLKDPVHVLLSAGGWTGMTGAANLVAQQLGGRVSLLTPPPGGASINSMAMLDQVLAHGEEHSSPWDRLMKIIKQTRH
jgi:cell division ATPase FtsA